MITSLPVPIYSQRDPRWSGVRLGTVNGTTIGSYGCLITSIAMMDAGFDPEHPWDPKQTDQAFTDHQGYANGNLVVWNAINRILPNSKAVGTTYCATSPAPVEALRGHLDSGGLALLRVGFGGDPKVMHWLLAVGYTAGLGGSLDIIFHDPWTGNRTQFQFSRYGTGVAEKDILEVHYFIDGIPEQIVKPQEPVAKLPAVHPLEVADPTIPVPAPAPEPEPEPVAPEPEPEPGRGSGEVVPIGVVDRVALSEDRTIQRDGAFAFDAQAGRKVEASRGKLPLGKVVAVAETFTYAPTGKRYARTNFSALHGFWNAVETIYFEPSNGNASGDVPFKVVPSAELKQALATNPQVANLWKELQEVIARLTAAVIRRKIT